MGTQNLTKVPMGTRVPKWGPTWEQCIYHQGSLLAPALWLFHPAYPTVSHQSLWIATIVSMQLKATPTTSHNAIITKVHNSTTTFVKAYSCPQTSLLTISEYVLCLFFFVESEMVDMLQTLRGSFPLLCSSLLFIGVFIRAKAAWPNSNREPGSCSHFCNQSTHAPPCSGGKKDQFCSA